MEIPEHAPRVEILEHELGEINLLDLFTGTYCSLVSDRGTCALHTLQVRRLSVLAGPDEPHRIPARGPCALVREAQVRREFAGGVNLVV